MIEKKLNFFEAMEIAHFEGTVSGITYTYIIEHHISYCGLRGAQNLRNEVDFEIN